MKMFVRDNLFSVLTLLLGILCISIALQYSAESSGFPRAVASFLVILATADLFRNARAQPQPIEASGDTSSGNDRKYLVAALLVFLSAPAYTILTRLFDFEIATFVYLVVGMYSLGMRKPILIVAISIGVLVTVKGLFFVLLDVTRSSTMVFGT